MAQTEEKEIYSIVADALEADAIESGDDYRRLPLWGSLAAFMIKVSVARRFGKELALSEIGGFASAGELARRILG
ncbi:MAG: hypothetical protein IIT98_03490 [Kiritimatiellae bacterium]|nr:hypothetical protein [Kiritimatiellia bacterium]